MRANDPDNGLWRYRYDDDGRMVLSIDAKGQNTGFAYDSLARMTQRTTLSGTPGATTVLTRTYDEARGGLIEALKRPTSQTISYTYDRINNLTFKTGYGTYTYPANGQPRPHAPTQVGTASLSYDANGSLTLSTGDPRISKAITWDGLNRIASVARGGQTVMTYAPNDSRLTRTFTPLGGTASTTTFFADMEVSPAGILTKYPVSDAKRIAFETYGVHLDHNGSVRAITDRVGTTITRLAYLPYGTETRTVIATPPVEETKGYISERYDDSTGLMDLNARYYDPRIARFVQPDMLDRNLPGVGVNRYAYGLNDPINNSDRGGQLAQSIIGGIVGVAVQGGLDLYNGELSSSEAYVAAATAGAVGAATFGVSTALAAGGVVARGALSGAAAEATYIVVGEGRAPSALELASGAAIGGITGGLISPSAANAARSPTRQGINISANTALTDVPTRGIHLNVYLGQDRSRSAHVRLGVEDGVLTARMSASAEARKFGSRVSSKMEQAAPDRIRSDRNTREKLSKVARDYASGNIDDASRAQFNEIADILDSL